MGVFGPPQKYAHHGGDHHHLADDNMKSSEGTRETAHHQNNQGGSQQVDEEKCQKPHQHQERYDPYKAGTINGVVLFPVDPIHQKR